MKYRRLDASGQEFRLLALLPPQDNLVRCVLLNESLVKPPEYRALSYCWGDPEVTTAIVVNGHEVQVTTNLEKALQSLQTLSYQKLWVDAICINQKDVAERGHQVGRMGLIYSRAHEVLGWLGCEGPKTTQVFKAILERQQLNIKTHEEGLQDLFSRHLWQRVWVIQEIAKAPNVRVFCGPIGVTWTEFCIAMEPLGIEPFSTGRFTSNIANGWRMLRDFRVTEQSGQRPTVLHALVHSKNFKSQLWRDKIYALLSITSDSTRVVPTPDYSQSDEDFNWLLSEQMVSRRAGFPSILLARFSNHAVLNMPSWMIDWSVFERNVTPWVLASLNDDSAQTCHSEILPPLLEDRMYATNGHSGSFKYLALKVTARCCGRIVEDITDEARVTRYYQYKDLYGRERARSSKMKLVRYEIDNRHKISWESDPPSYDELSVYKAARKHDKIFLLDIMRIMVVLRPLGSETYQYIGESSKILAEDDLMLAISQAQLRERWFSIHII